ncbi:MAG: hypothetical protein E2598_06615 [Sphingobium sp.]|nr:hypothetical protein [Sphingobium sp.]
MKIKRSSMFEGSPRRRSPFPIIPVVAAAVLILVLIVAWQRGGEKPQAPVEKAIPAEKLGQ